jgi:hypothetical protein
MLWIEDNFESTLSFSFLINSRVDMADFVNHHKMVAWKSAFSALSSARNQNELKRWARKWRVETSIFTNERGFELIRNLRTSSQSKEKNIKEEDGYDERGRLKNWKNWSDGEVLHPHCSKKRNGHQAFRHTHCTLRKSVFFKCEEGFNSRFNLLHIGPWTLI